MILKGRPPLPILVPAELLFGKGVAAVLPILLLPTLLLLVPPVSDDPVVAASFKDADSNVDEAPELLID